MVSSFYRSWNYYFPVDRNRPFTVYLLIEPKLWDDGFSSSEFIVVDIVVFIGDIMGLE